MQTAASDADADAARYAELYDAARTGKLQAVYVYITYNIIIYNIILLTGSTPPMPSVC